MRHFSSELWADFARDVDGGDQRTLMESHLRTECRQCVTALRVWRHVRDAAKREAAYGPQDAVVRTVKGRYAIHGEGASERKRERIVKLLFDTLQSPLPEGVRSATPTTRQ